MFEENKFGETSLEVNWSVVENNMLQLKKLLHSDTLMMLMVKAAAYGHGAIGIASLAEKSGLIDYLGVVNVDEGIELRKAGVQLPIMVQNPKPAEWQVFLDHHLEPEIHSIELLSSFSDFVRESENKDQHPHPIHIKLNTGMNRLGIDSKELSALIAIIEGNEALRIRSVLTHLSSAGESKDDDFTNMQFNEFDRMLQELKVILDDSCLIHALNSEGVGRHSDKQYKMIRTGIGIYGNSSNSSLKEITKPATKLLTKVIATRRVEKGGTISYSRSGVAEKDSNIAVLSIGYADGLPVRLGNGKWMMEINNKLYPSIGVVCMDLCMVDLGEDVVKAGDDAIVFGGQKDIFDFAEAMCVSTYEAMTGISSRVKKVIIAD